MSTQKNESQAQAKKEQSQIMTFNFSESQTEIRSLMLNKEPWLVAKDICSVLGISKHRDAISKLDDDERGSVKMDTLGGMQTVSIVNESGMYTLIMRSNKPQAKTFRKWVTSEVLPTIRKKGYYNHGNQQLKNDYIDARDIPYFTKEINDYQVRAIDIDGTIWVSINDVNKAIRSSTGSNQLSKKLNIKQTLAIKIWLFGNTHPAWFTNEKGVQLILLGSRKLNGANQLKLNLSAGGQASC